MNTLATPPQNIQAVSTPSTLNYDAIVKQCAARKADNGAQFTSSKGKASLLSVAIDCVRSQLGISKFDENGKRNAIPDDKFKELRQAVDLFWHNEAREIVEQAIAKDARITVRRGVLMSRVNGKGVIIRSKTDKITSVYVPEAKEHKLADMFGHQAAESRLNTMLDNPGRYSREEIQAQRETVEKLAQAIESHK